MSYTPSRRQVLSTLSLALITAISVDSLRNLPATALFGSSLPFFFLLAAVFFLIPCALVAAELTSTSNEHGGVYVWVKNAFGPQMGFLAVWFQWIENVIWYPTILSFVAGTIGYLISPAIVNNKFFLVLVIVTTFWGCTLVNLFGIKMSAAFSNLCAWTGLLIPMTLIIILGIMWGISGKPMQIHFSSQALMPHLGNTDVWVAITGIVLSFCGMEIATVHGFDVKNPQSAYPKAMLLATFIIIFTLLSGALAIALVLPQAQISLVAGIMQAFNAFFAVYHLQWILPVIAVMLVLGGTGSISNWIIAPTRGLLIAAKAGHMPEHFQKQNQHGAPNRILLYQAIIVTVISLVFLLMPSVNGSYWFLTALTSQLYMMMYLIMFAAAIRLRYTKHNQVKGFRIPGGNWGIWLVCLAGLLGSIATFMIGFIPPPGVNVGGLLHYEFYLVLGLLVMSIPPLLLHFYRKRNLLRISPLESIS